MDHKRIASGLGWFSLALGLTEIVAGRRIARGMGVQGATWLVRAFGVRELAAGGALLAAPAQSANSWMRVAGDAMDLAALGVAAGRSPSRAPVWGAIAFVAAATALDVHTARGLDRTTGRFLPSRPGQAPA